MSGLWKCLRVLLIAAFGLFLAIEASTAQDEDWRTLNLRLPPDTHGQTHPDDCRVIQVESKGFVKLHCRTYQAMVAYEHYCCETSSCRFCKPDGFEFSSYSYWYYREHSKPVDAPAAGATVTAEEAYKLGIRYRQAIPPDLRRSFLWERKGALGGDFNAMIEVADQYRHYYEEAGVSRDAGQKYADFWIAKAWEHAERTQDNGELYYMRNWWPKPGQQTIGDKFNGMMVAIVEAEVRARKEARRCVAEVRARDHTAQEIYDCGPTD
jgi:hypothetical protein